MKKIYLCLLLFSVSFLGFSQTEKWRQKNARINFVVTPEINIHKVAGKFSPIASLNGSIAFNNTYFVGLYGSKKILRNYNEYSFVPGAKFDVSYQHVGAEFLYSMKLGLYRTQGGHYVMRKMRVTYDLKLGGGLVWLVGEDKKRASVSDYFYYGQPSVGVLWPLNDFMQINAGAYYSVLLKINKLHYFFASKDFQGPGAFVALRVNIFR